MNDVDQLLSELNPMKQSPPPDVRSSEAEAIYEAAMARFTTQSPLLPWYKALVGRPADTRGLSARRKWVATPGKRIARASIARRQISVVLVAAVILAVFFAPLPHVSLFKRLVAPAKPSARLPGANPLADSSLVASGLTLPLRRTGRLGKGPTAQGPAVVAYLGIGRSVVVAHVSDPFGYWPNDFGTAVVGGDAVVMEKLSENGPNFGRAVAIRPGTAQQVSLGNASLVFPGSQSGTVWILTSLPSACTIREVSVAGAVLVQPVRLSCSWTVLGVADGGLVIAPDGFDSSFADTVEIWNPVTRAVSHRFGLPDAYGADISDGVAATDVNNFRNHESVQKVFISDLGASRYYAINLQAAPGMAFPWYAPAVLSPNGRYLAIEETTLAYDREQERLAEETGPPQGGGCAVVACTSPVTGLVAVFDVATGDVVLQRKLSFLDLGGSSVAWSPDGSWLFLTASNRTIAAVPTFSTSAAVHIVTLTRSAGLGSVGSENFVVVGKP